jgi:hypothetical protein
LLQRMGCTSRKPETGVTSRGAFPAPAPEGTELLMFPDSPPPGGLLLAQAESTMAVSSSPMILFVAFITASTSRQGRWFRCEPWLHGRTENIPAANRERGARDPPLPMHMCTGQQTLSVAQLYRDSSELSKYGLNISSGLDGLVYL